MDDQERLENETPATKPKITRQRRKRSPNRPPKRELNTLPMPLTEKEHTVQAKEIPRLSHWVCRDDECFWTRADHGGCLYKKGDVITVDFADHEKAHRFDFARGWWYPEGVKVVDLKTMRCIPQQFEPFHPDGKVETMELWKRLLVDPLKLNYSRANVQVGRKGNPFYFKEESEDRVSDVAALGMPEPVSPQSLTKPEAPPEKFNPSELMPRGGMH